MSLLRTHCHGDQIKKGERRVGHVAGMEEIRNTYKILTENLKERNQLEDLRVVGRITVHGYNRNSKCMVVLDLFGSR
jgi:hypothetical protein